NETKGSVERGLGDEAAFGHRLEIGVPQGERATRILGAEMGTVSHLVEAVGRVFFRRRARRRDRGPALGGAGRPRRRRQRRRGGRAPPARNERASAEPTTEARAGVRGVGARPARSPWRPERIPERRRKVRRRWLHPPGERLSATRARAPEPSRNARKSAPWGTI